MMKIAHDDAEAWYPKPHLPATEVARLRTNRDALSRINQVLAEENASLHRLLYEMQVTRTPQCIKEGRSCAGYDELWQENERNKRLLNEVRYGK